MGTAAERLVRDRFAEFQRLAQSKGVLTPMTSRALSGVENATASRSLNAFSTAARDTPVETNSFMREFFTGVKELQGLLDQGRQRQGDGTDP